MSQDDDLVMNQALVDYLRYMGVPVLLAKLAIWLTRTVQTEKTSVVGVDASHVRSVLQAWFADHGNGNQLQSGDHAPNFEMRGVTLVEGSALGSLNPKLVLATVTVSSDTPEQTRITIHTKTKVGRFAGRKIVTVATTACERVATDIIIAITASMES